MRSNAAGRHRETSRTNSWWRCARAQCAYRLRACVDPLQSALAYYLVVLREDLPLSLLENILKASRELSEIDCRRQKQKFYLLTWSL